jgi:hypothetical protein
MQIPSNFTASVLQEGASEEKGENARLVRRLRSIGDFFSCDIDA